MLEQVLRELKNWFVVDSHTSEYTVEDGGITLPFLSEGQYFRVLGSIFNDGVYKYPAELKNETFTGTICVLAIPQAVVELAEKVEKWEEKYGDSGPYASESFGGYSYSKATDPATGGVMTWRGAFRSELNKWRKL